MLAIRDVLFAAKFFNLATLLAIETNRNFSPLCGHRKLHVKVTHFAERKLPCSGKDRGQRCQHGNRVTKQLTRHMFESPILSLNG